jgi:ABC-type phosphate transport system permease subunit
MTTDTIRIVAPLIGMIIGIVLIIGANRGWELLIDPPDEWSSWYPFSLIKKLFGSGFLVGYIYFFGFTFAIFSAIFLIGTLLNK